MQVMNPLEIPKRRQMKHKLSKTKKLRAEKDLFMMNFKVNNVTFPVPAHGYGVSDSRGDLRPNYQFLTNQQQARFNETQVKKSSSKHPYINDNNMP